MCIDSPVRHRCCRWCHSVCWQSLKHGNDGLGYKEASDATKGFGLLPALLGLTFTCQEYGSRQRTSGPLQSGGHLMMCSVIFAPNSEATASSALMLLAAVVSTHLAVSGNTVRIGCTLHGWVGRTATLLENWNRWLPDATEQVLTSLFCPFFTGRQSLSHTCFVRSTQNTSGGR